MLRMMHDILGYRLASKDDEFGRVKDFLFDDQWTVRYLVADTGRWIPHRKVLISPAVLGHPDWDEKDFPVNLTREQIEKQPELDPDHVVSRWDEWQWFAAYDYPYYYAMDSSMTWGYGMMPESIHKIQQLENAAEEVAPPEKLADDVFQSLKQIRGFMITSGAESIGTLDDLVMDDETWQIRYIKVNAELLKTRRMLLLAPDWLDDPNWSDGTIECTIPRDQVCSSPGFHPGQTIERGYELQLHAHYGRPTYWSPTGTE